MTVTTWKLVGSEIGCLTDLIIARLYGLARGLVSLAGGNFLHRWTGWRGFWIGLGGWIPACAGMTVGGWNDGWGVGMAVGG